MVALYLATAYLLLPRLWLHYEHQPHLAPRPMVTRTTQDIPGDPINVGLVGSKEEVIRAFAAAGWHPADAITLRSSIDIGASVVLDRPDVAAPVSTLLFEGRKQDLAFEMPVGQQRRSAPPCPLLAACSQKGAGGTAGLARIARVSTWASG